jgi:TonB family protein
MTRRILAAAIVLTLGRSAAAADLATVKALYGSAEYEQALAQIEKDATAGDVVEMEQYRALCLIALGRTPDAERSLERIVRERPLHAALDADVSPRLVTMFADVRRRVLPSSARGQYAAAKEQFDAGDFAAAMNAFGTLLEILDDPALRDRNDMSDLKQLAEGFLLLSKTQLSRTEPPAPAASVPDAPVARSAPAVYSSADPDVIPPVAIEKSLPPWAPPAGRAREEVRGRLVIVVDEKGSVSSASLPMPLSPAYDRSLIAAAQGWRFKPATKDGVPVKYITTLAIVLKPE